MPENASRHAASWSSRTRRAVRLSVSTQYRRSWRNSGWKIGSRSAARGKPHLPAQLLKRLVLAPASFGAPQSRQQTLGISRGTEQVGGFHEPGQLPGRNQRDILGILAANNDDFLVLGNRLQEGGESFPQMRVTGLDGRYPPPHLMYRFPVLLAILLAKPRKEGRRCWVSGLEGRSLWCRKAQATREGIRKILDRICGRGGRRRPSVRAAGRGGISSRGSRRRALS